MMNQQQQQGGGMSSPGSSNGMTPGSSPTSVGGIIGRKRKPQSTISASMMLLLIFTNGISFLAGSMYASNAHIKANFPPPDVNSPNRERKLPGLQPDSTNCPKVKCAPVVPCPPEKKCPACNCPPPKECPPEKPPSSSLRAASTTTTTSSTNGNPFPDSVNRFVVGFSYTTQENFTKTYDLGVPIDRPQKEGDTGVLILYNTPESRPRRFQQTPSKSGASRPLSALEATENCDQMNVVLSYHEGRRKQCTAIVPQYESFHIQKWMRVPEDIGREHGGHLPLRMVPRGHKMDGESAFHPPHHEKHTKKHWKMLEAYLDSIEDVLRELKPIVNRIKRDNAIVVMVCNFGQSQLLLNFACAAKSKGLDISSVLVFATDRETKELAEGVGLTVYFDERNFGNMPKDAAQVYGDGAFTRMMLSKVICVHMISLLNVDMLFQDVDVIWYKHPLDYFQKTISRTSLADFDAYFQDDGSRSLRFAPYCANSGFYFFRANDRTRYFMTSFLMQSDLVLRSFSHQSAMIALLAEHSSLLGLRVKTLDPFDFPAGYIYHRKKGKGPFGNFFVDMFDQDNNGKVDPYIFHMSWTENKHNKILFYRQLDQWYLQDKCMDTELAKIDGVHVKVSLVDGYVTGNFVESCCSAQPLFSCHFKDKPSSRPCKDSPTLDKNGVSWW